MTPSDPECAGARTPVCWDIYTIGGTGTAFPANGVPAARAGFSGFGLAVTAAGNLQVSDLPDNRILGQPRTACSAEPDCSGSGRRIMRNEMSRPASPARMGMRSAT